MKKNLAVLMSVFCVAGVFAGCSGNGGNANSSNAQTVSLDGSTSMEKVIGYLSEAYMQDNPDVKITFNPTGSGSGIQAVTQGRCDIGLSSRELEDEEIAKGLVGTVVAIDGIAVIMHPNNPVNNLSMDQIEDIFDGDITNWNQVGGSDAPIVCIGREAQSGTRDGFESITDTEDDCKYSQELTSTGDVVQTVSGNPNAIGYASLASVKDNVKILSVEGVAPSMETIQNGTYKIQRNFLLVTKSDKPLEGSAKAFYDYSVSGNADELITKAGAVPVKR